MNEEWAELSGDDLDMGRTERNCDKNSGKKFGTTR